MKWIASRYNGFNALPEPDSKVGESPSMVVVSADRLGLPPSARFVQETRPCPCAPARPRDRLAGDLDRGSVLGLPVWTHGGEGAANL